eukprot:PhM_4_TR8320/c0_g1_i4/m.21722
MMQKKRGRAVRCEEARTRTLQLKPYADGFRELVAGCRADAPAVQQLLASLDYDQREELESLAIGEMQHFGTKFPAVNRPGMSLSEFRELVAGCRADAPAVQQLLATGPLQWPYKSKGFKLNICRRRLLAALVGIFRPSLR